MQRIANAQTSADYATATTIGPDNFEGISVEVWNASCIMQVHTQPEGGYQVGEWADEVLVSAGATPYLGRCAGVRFKTNSATPTLPARIIAYAWKDGEPQIAPGSQVQGTLAGTGGITGGVLITGLVNADGSIAGGSGFTVAHPSAGRYDVTFTTPFASLPLVFPAVIGNTTRTITYDNVATNMARIHINDAGGTNVDEPFSFGAQAIV